jgi:hypothetical protein
MEQQIIAGLQAANGHLTRNELWQRLPGLQDGPNDEYWAAEQALVDGHRIERRRGRNGGIYLLEPVEAARQAAGPAEAAQAVAGQVAAEAEAQRLESDHYQPALDSILQHWTEQPGFTHVFGAITAGQGRRQTGGRWSRPDIVLCAISDWLFSSRPEADVRTIEVKRFESLDVLAVYEAVSHKSRAHYSYLLIVDFPADMDADQKTTFDTVVSVAGKHGIGVITARNTADWTSWSFELDPNRSDSDHQAVNQFLLDQVPPEIRDQFRRAIREINVKIVT